MRLYKFLLQEGVYDPNIFKAIFLAGGPGSGKSFVAEHVTVPGFKTVSSDVLFEYLGKEEGLDLKTFPDSETAARDKIRQTAKDLTNKAMLRFINNRIGLIVDGTGHNYDKISKQWKILKNIGYDCFMIFVNTSLDVALERNQQRPRQLKEPLVIKGWNAVQRNMGKFQSLFGSDKFRIIDNNEYAKTKTIKTVIGKRTIVDSKVFTDIYKDIMKFSKRPIENHRANLWISAQVERKKYSKGKETLPKDFDITTDLMTVGKTL